MANSSATADSSARPVPEGFVRLVSADNYEFLVEEESVSVSKVIKKLLEGKSIKLCTISTHMLER